MSKITLDVDKNDINTVMTILNNLKAGLVKNITIDNKRVSSLPTKKAIKKVILEDEFMPKQNTSSKYVSKEAFKERLAKNKK